MQRWVPEAVRKPLLYAICTGRMYMRCTKFLLVGQIIIKVFAELGVHVDLEDDNHQDWRDGDCHLGGAETDLQTNGCIEGAIRHSEYYYDGHSLRIMRHCIKKSENKTLLMMTFHKRCSSKSGQPRHKFKRRLTPPVSTFVTNTNINWYWCEISFRKARKNV